METLAEDEGIWRFKLCCCGMGNGWIGLLITTIDGGGAEMGSIGPIRNCINEEEIFHGKQSAMLVVNCQGGFSKPTLHFLVFIKALT